MKRSLSLSDLAIVFGLVLSILVVYAQVVHIWQTLWPVKLAAFYPYPKLLSGVWRCCRLRLAIQLNPDDEAANNDLGTCLLRSDLGDEAIPYFQAALRLDLEAHRRYGRLLMILGQNQAALAHLEEAQRIQPNGDTASAIATLRRSIN